MSELFKEYEQTFRTQLHEIQLACDRIQYERATEKELPQTQRLLASAEQTLQRMTIEAQSASLSSPNESRTAMGKIENCKVELKVFSEKFRKIRTDAERLSLLDGSEVSGSGKSADHRQRLLDVTDRLERGNVHLEESQRMAAESENLSLEICNNLASQRQVIARSRANMGTVSDNLDQARLRIYEIARKAIKNKIILYGIILAITIVIFIIVFKNFSKLAKLVHSK